MGSGRQIFLVIALLLTISSLGVHGGETKRCRTNKDCPPCKIGTPLCTDGGKCSCLDMKLQSADVDCPKICPERCQGCAYVCKLGQCFCAC